jgi:hypothetical protein
VSHVLVPELDRHVSHVSAKSYAMLTEEPEARHVAIFVRGFGWHPFKTRSQIQELITIDDSWKVVSVQHHGSAGGRSIVSQLRKVRPRYGLVRIWSTAVLPEESNGV